jgi:hypothetical protein
MTDVDIAARGGWTFSESNVSSLAGWSDGFHKCCAKALYVQTQETGLEWIGLHQSR